MLRLLVGTSLLLALAVVAVRADGEKKEEKSAIATFNDQFKDLLNKYRAAKSDEQREKLLADYADKFIDLAEKAKQAEGVDIVLLMPQRMPIPDGVQPRIAALLKKALDKSSDDKVRTRALPAYLNAQSAAIRASKDATRTEAARKDLETYANKFLDQVAKELDKPASVNSLVLAAGLALPGGKHGARARTRQLFERLLEKREKDQRLPAITAYLGAQEQVAMTSKDADEVAAARQELAAYRKVLHTDYKGKVKDLFIGAPMPDLTSKNLEDKDVKLTDLRGKVVVLDIWATWCPPCKAMIPHERDMVKKLKGKPFTLVSISFDAKKETLTKFLESTEMPWTHWWEGQGGKIDQELNVRSFPTIYILDGKGVIRYKNLRGKQMEDAVEVLLRETEDRTKPKN